MNRCARFALSLLLLAATWVSLANPAQSQIQQIQQTASASKSETAEKEKNLKARHQAGLTMLEQVVAGARSLSLPQNRIAIASEAFPILWTRDEAHARTLVNQMVGDFAQAASQEEQSTDRGESQSLRQQRQIAIQAISQADAELALSFMNATRSFVRIGNSEQEEAEERDLRLQIAIQEAAHNPRNALRMAEKDLQTPGELPPELISLLSQVAAKDPEAGEQLLHEIVDRVRSGDLASDNGNLNFALNLLGSQTGAGNGSSADTAAKTLADAIISAGISPQFSQGMLPTLQGWLPTLEQIAPGRTSALQQKVEDYFQPGDSGDDGPDPVQEAQASGDPNRMVVAAEDAPRNMRFNLYQQAAWQFAGNGDLQRADATLENIQDPFQREQLRDQMIQQSAWNAVNRGDITVAWQLVRELTSEDDRATLLAQFAENAAHAKQPTLAQQMIEEAFGLVATRAESASTFAAQLQVAQALVQIKPARALPLLERSASQLDQVLAAVCQVDAFLPMRSFRGGELLLNNGFLFGSLIRPYAEAAASLASYDVTVARTLADRLSLPEARLMAELLIARNALNDSQ